VQLSILQKFILIKTWENKKNTISRQIFDSFYSSKKNPPAAKIRANIITKSIERLIDRGLLIGLGEKTQHKLFINQVRLTPKGKKTTISLLDRQAQFPFIKKINKK